MKPYLPLSPATTNPSFSENTNLSYFTEITSFPVLSTKPYFAPYLSYSLPKHTFEKTDRKLFAAMIKLYRENVDEQFYPKILKDFDKITKKVQVQDKYKYFADYVYEKSVFSNQEKFNNFIKKRDSKNYEIPENDPIANFAEELYQYSGTKTKILERVRNFNSQIDSLNRVYMQAQIEFQKDKYLYPDANFTLRVTYGKIKAFKPADGIIYKHFTTLDGIMEKDNPDVYDYDVPKKLKELYKSKDYGKYTDINSGKIPVCFIAMNHTSGGNSGSPVLNANGELIGVNFDRNWEGTMSDIMYDPSICRNISIDIRYALFIIDKFANAQHLLDEMVIGF